MDGTLWKIDHATGEVIGPTIIAHPGTTSQHPDGAGQLLSTFGDYSIPANVTDDGIVTGYTSHTEVLSYEAGGTDSGGTSSGTYYTTDKDIKNTVFVWDSVTDEFQIIGDGFAASSADDAAAIAGNSTHGELTYYSRTHYNPDADYTSTSFGYEWLNVYRFGWYLDTGKDPHVLTTFGAQTKAYDVSEDGEATVGCTVIDAVGNPGLPMLWMTDGTEIQLDLPDTHTNGWASAIAFATQHIKTFDDE
jgi:hypothetical protein